MSEFTADRAGLLACQNVDVAINSIIKMSGMPAKYFNNMNRKAFLEQAKDFEAKYGGLMDKVIKGISIVNDSHPWTIMRAAELIKWIESGEYKRVWKSYNGKVCPVCRMEVPKDSTICPYCGNVFQ